MLNPFLASAVIVVLLSGCASRTTTQNLNEDAQTIMTLGFNKIGKAYNDSDKATNENFKTVRISISGQVVLGEKCQFSAFRTHYLVELRRKNSSQSKPTAAVGLYENFYYQIDDNVNPGDYVLNFIYYRNGQMLQSIPIKIDGSHDRFTFNFNGCP